MLSALEIKREVLGMAASGSYLMNINAHHTPIILKEMATLRSGCWSMKWVWSTNR